MQFATDLSRGINFPARYLSNKCWKPEYGSVKRTLLFPPVWLQQSIYKSISSCVNATPSFQMNWPNNNRVGHGPYNTLIVRSQDDAASVIASSMCGVPSLRTIITTVVVVYHLRFGTCQFSTNAGRSTTRIHQRTPSIKDD